jgi:hypothetical protein
MLRFHIHTLPWLRRIMPVRHSAAVEANQTANYAPLGLPGLWYAASGVQLRSILGLGQKFRTF